MKRKILFVTIITMFTQQQCRGQHSVTAADSHALQDSARSKTNSGPMKLSANGVPLLEAWIDSGAAGNGVWFGTRTNAAFYLFTDSGKARITIQPSGKIYLANSLAVNGTTTTKILTITGGADLAEPFAVSEREPIPAGAVMVIDELSPGMLKLCRKAYDTRVAGVVSGAAGVNSGLILQQEEKLAQGRDIALNGRLYALATATNGAIKPGDLLTTSHIAGHAMKATDKAAAFGAIVGKALTGLEAGEGLVLMVVNLQ